MGKKKNYQRICECIDELASSSILRKSQRWWPKYVYHFTNIDNAVRILESGYLYSRTKAESKGLMQNDNASCEVIENTDSRWLDYVRLYFRPKTPTQWHNEGFIPVEHRFKDSHCPVPIYFLFDSKSVLSRANTLFSDSSLARKESNYNVYSNAEDFIELPFEYIYHDSYFDGLDKELIIGARHAEVIIPDKLALSDLKVIWCRSEAEYNTLLFLLGSLSPDKYEEWKNKIGAGKKGNLFNRRWIFVERTELSEEEIVFYFNEPDNKSIEFAIKVEIKEMRTGILYTWKEENYRPTDDFKLEIDLGNLEFPNEYEIKLYFDGQLMYADRFLDIESIPF